jgi:lipopolysaccharide/colanic/teichoic acid biosynthesis glycosyltransferase
VKRVFDIGLVFLFALCWLPLMGLVALVTRIFLGRPVLFRQTRAGFQGRPFVLFKFRTMRNVIGPDGSPAPDAERLTPYGSWLRSTSLDELPELINVLRGEMSLVGPRPLLIEYLPLYSPIQARRHEVRPGMAGLAQVMGRNALTWEEKFAWDVYYVDHQTFWLDLKILTMTAKKVLLREGICAEGEATMPKFKSDRNLQRGGADQ